MSLKPHASSSLSELKKKSPTNLLSSSVTGAEVGVGASAAALSLLIVCEELQWNTEQASVAETSRQIRETSCRELRFFEKSVGSVINDERKLLNGSEVHYMEQ